MDHPTLTESLVRALIKFPQHFLGYVVGLVVATLDDYTLITLIIVAALTGVLLSSILGGVLVYFGGYFVVRLVGVINNALGFGAQGIAQALVGQPPSEPPPSA